MIEGQEIAMEQPSSMTRNLEVLDELKAYVLSSNETVERQLETSKSQNKEIHCSRSHDLKIKQAILLK